MAMILVTHDLGVVAGAHRRDHRDVRRQRGGAGPTNVLFKSMAMPYTEALLKSTHASPSRAARG